MSVASPARSNGSMDPPLFQLGEDFTVTVSELTTAELSSAAAAAWTDTPEVPTLGELKQQIQASGKQAWIVEFRKHGNLVSVFPVLIEIRTVRGIALRTLSLAGYDFYDYLPFSHVGVPDAIWGAGVRRVCVHFHADAAYLNNLVEAPTGRLAAFSQAFSNTCFDQATGNGWQSLLKVESVKRVVNKAKRLHRYSVKTYEGLPPPELLNVIAELHIERWRYDGVTSPFTKITRRNEYAASAGRALCIVIFDSDTVIAASINMVFGKRLLWHTPVVNIEYLRASPLKLLLHETISECARRDFEIFDFGLGDEAYKNRFCNFKRPMWNLFLPCTMRGYFASSLLNWAAAKSLKTLVVTWRSRIARHLAKPPLVLAGAPAVSPLTVAEPPIGLTWQKIEDFSDFVRWCREVGIDPTRHDHDRLKAGAYCLFAIVNGRVIGKCWILSAIQWSDSTCVFTLNVPVEKIWVFGAEATNGAHIADLYSSFASYFGTTDLRIVFDSTNRHGIPAAIHAGFIGASDITIHPAKSLSDAELN